ncbi:MAG: hypothetical protein J4N84_17145 [Chloroflexi bacterium]|nr:hypothetical protein [Chloroflexota bacterium]MCI0896623.1 hypothetical protein [Chloroflexota bacterium]
MTTLVYDTLPDDATFYPLGSLPARFSRFPIVSQRGVRVSPNSPWDRLWSRLLREVGDA